MELSSQMAHDLVMAYLSGRTMPDILYEAVVEVARRRILNGEFPVLNRTMKSDIDNQAGALHDRLSRQAAPWVPGALHSESSVAAPSR